MTVCTITISDAPDSSVNMNGVIDDPTAIDRPPTAALVIGSYIAANADRVCKDAVAWFQREIPKDDDVQGAPI